MIGFSSPVSDTLDSLCSPYWSYWDSGAIVDGALVRSAIDNSIGSKAFGAFTKNTTVSWDVDELYSTFFFCINGGTGV